MSIKNIVFPTTGLADALPGLLYIDTNDTLAVVTATGYLNQAKPIYGNIFSNKQMAATYTTDQGCVLFKVVISADGINATLASSADAGLIALPTVVDQFVYATNTNGALAASGATRLFNAGGIDAGLSGTAGTFRSYPATAANGYLEVFGTANGGARNVTVTNAAHGQTTGYVIPDAGNAAGRILVGATATPFTTGHLLASSGTGGLVADSGVATTAIQLKANILAAHSADIGGAGAGPIDVTVAGLTSASVVVASILSSTNTVSISKVLPGTGKFTITFSADPGAACVLNYVAFVAAQ